MKIEVEYSTSKKIITVGKYSMHIYQNLVVYVLGWIRSGSDFPSTEDVYKILDTLSKTPHIEDIYNIILKRIKNWGYLNYSENKILQYMVINCHDRIPNDILLGIIFDRKYMPRVKRNNGY